MATPNPNPTRISSAIWRLWTEFDRIEPSALLSGIYAGKSGYHNYRNALPSGDYSVEDVFADRQGPGQYASGIDLTLSDAAMRKYTSRLDVAARARDPRLYPPGKAPVLREFIGTKNSSTVYCYVLTGGFPLGVGADAGTDSGRDDSHLWHIHLSIIRLYCDNWAALSGVLSVLAGQTLNDWNGGTVTEQQVWATTERMEALALGKSTVTTSWSGANPNAVEQQWLVNTVKGLVLAVGAIATALPNVDDAVAAQLAGTLADLQDAVEASPAQVVALLAAQPAENAAQLVLASVGEERTRALAEAMLALVNGTPE